MGLARRRCATFRTVLNNPADTEWVIRNWDQQWNTGGTRASVAYRIKIAEYLQPLNRYATQAIYDGDTLIAGATQIIHGDTSVAGVLYYLPEYRQRGVARRLISSRGAGLRADGYPASQGKRKASPPARGGGAFRFAIFIVERGAAPDDGGPAFSFRRPPRGVRARP